MSRLARFLGTAVLLGMVALLPSCGGGGGGGGGAPPFEMAYVLEENQTTYSGQIEYFPMNPGNGSFYPDSGASPVSTRGTVPISLLADPANNNFLYVLNNNNTTVDGTASGSVQGFSAAGYQKTMSPVGTAISTGPNPVSMAIDPGGHYLVVADHGNGSSSCSSSPCGDVEVFTISSGIITLLGTVSSPNLCKNPFRVVFAPGA
ncbi:MAG: beta-propeller fold lactonase family protein, partial [Nitrospiraceae bacterium]|nr:beta-propeller fold lactonase family protein [Nitrospiraceae bacterium]